MDTAELNPDFNSQPAEDDNRKNPIPLQKQEYPPPEETPTTVRMEIGGDKDSGGGREGHLEQHDPQLGMEFDSLESAKKFYYDYAERNGFRARAGKCRTSLRDDSIIMKQFTCYKEGFSAKKQRHGDNGKERRNRISIREGCKAMIQLSRRDHEKWVVSKFVSEHTHTLGEVKVQKVKKQRLVPVIPVEMRALFEDEVRPDSILGGGESFGLLEYLKMQQSKNPAFFYSIQVDEYDRLTNVFWASARARMAYSYFGDVVNFDTTYKRNKNMMPFAPFTGVNHHLQPVVFGCALLVDDTEASLNWLFQTFLVAMCGCHPASLVTDYSDSLAAAAVKVFHGTRHRFCKWDILSKCEKKLPDLCSKEDSQCTFKRELKKCIDEFDTIEDFESGWEAILVKYNLKENEWMNSLYEVRQQWAKVYLKDTFFAEISPAQRSESMNKFFKRNFEMKTTLREFIMKFDQAMAVQYEKEVKADFANLYTGPVLRTVSPIEKQAAETYTKTIFTIFQEELIQSSAYMEDKVDDGVLVRYHVAYKGEDSNKAYTVTYNAAEMKARCSCGMFVFSGILCRHILRVFSALGFTMLPECYFLKRWKKIAKSGAVLYGAALELRQNDQTALTRCNNLCLEVLKFAEEGATSAVIYKVAKDALHKAFAEICAAREAVCSADAGGERKCCNSFLPAQHGRMLGSSVIMRSDLIIHDRGQATA